MTRTRYRRPLRLPLAAPLSDGKQEKPVASHWEGERAGDLGQASSRGGVPFPFFIEGRTRAVRFSCLFLRRPVDLFLCSANRALLIFVAFLFVVFFRVLAPHCGLAFSRRCVACIDRNPLASQRSTEGRGGEGECKGGCGSDGCPCVGRHVRFLAFTISLSFFKFSFFF